MRFRRRDADFEGLSERDAARLRAFLGQAQPTPGMEGLDFTGTSERVGDKLIVTLKPKTPIQSSDVLPRKRGRRA